MHLALYQPDIAGNVGAMVRTAACFGASVHIIEPSGFTWDQAAVRRAAMDYAAATVVRRHADVAAFFAAMRMDGRRITLLSRDGSHQVHHVDWMDDDAILVGSEGHGVPGSVAAACNRSVRIAMRPGLRSLNVGVAAGIALAEARRGMGWMDGMDGGDG